MKILGLDLGTNSIGWAVVDDENQEILDAGVRIFPEGVEPKTIGQGDKEKSKNATRRDHRQMRRQFYRKRLRKIKLLEVLIEQNMCPLSMEELRKWKNWDKKLKNEGRKFPQTPEFVNWLRMNPYELRNRAVAEQISLQELGRIFYHFIQRRGFLSTRKGTEDSSIFTSGNKTENILPINDTKDKIREKTLGQYLYAISYKTKEPYYLHNESGELNQRVRGRYTLRDMYIAEFEKIWSLQKKFYGLDNIKVFVKKTRELKGTENSGRNKKRLSQLKEKYGVNNIEVQTSDKGSVKVISREEQSLKECLAGKIEINNNPEEVSNLTFKSNDSVLFWQRPLKSQKSLLSNCRFENVLPVIKANGEFLRNKDGEIQLRSKKPCPISHPEFELFRTYQFVNNISYGKNNNRLTTEQIDLIVNLISKNDKNFDFKKIPAALKLTYEKFNFDDNHKVPGNSTIKQLKPHFDQEIWQKYAEDIWHCFYFYEDNDKLYEKVKRDYGYEGDLESVRKIKLTEGYGSVSLKAIRNILPFLKKGYQYDRAVVLGGVKNAFGKRWEYFREFHAKIEQEVVNILRKDNRQGEAIEEIKDYLSTPVFELGFVKNDAHFHHLYHHSEEIELKNGNADQIPIVENLRNPIVQQALHETRRLVNSLLSKYRGRYSDDFQFDQIKVEMGRDLRNNKKSRQEMSFRIRENETKNDEARERLKEYGLQASRNNIQKYLMYREIEQRAGKAQCPYTGKIISISNLLGNDNAIQIEHIIPFSISLDDSFGNKTLCEANFNRDKGEKTPFQFYKQNPDPKLWGASSWEEVSERAFRILPYAKAKRFTAKRDFNKSEFVERQLNDSRYIARKAVELLSSICKDVRVLPGQLTAELRHLWGLNSVLQPVLEVPTNSIDFDKNSSFACYAIMDENDSIVDIQPKYNAPPYSKDDEMLVSGYVKKGKFDSKQIHFSCEVPELADGKYWLKLKVDEIGQITQKFIEKPYADESSVVLKGRIEKGFFKNDSFGKLKVEKPDGSYWAKFEILQKKLEVPEKDKQPKAKRNQLVLYGSVSKGEFKCYVYKCETNLEDGKYWLILDLNPSDVEFIRAVNDEPTINDTQVIINATVDEDGLLVADNDPGYKLKTDLDKGKYFVVLSVSNPGSDICQVENEPPEVDGNQKVVEGNVWVDKYTGEIKFDPKKNRDDHRHHAIDALTIALTKQSYLQRLSTYNAQRKEKQRQKLDSTEHYPEPWQGFYNDVKDKASEILISHKKSNKTLTKTNKGFGVRGQLHKENVFGKRKAPGQEQAYHRRVRITDLKNHKHVGKVVDDSIRKLIIEHLSNNCGVDVNNAKGFTIPQDAFYKDGKWRLFLPNRKGDPVPVKKVRMKELMSNVAQLKSNANQYVNPRNNHHVVIYIDQNGEMQEEVVQFWTVIERRLQGENIYQLPSDGKSIVEVLEINDMFLLGLSEEEYRSNSHNYAFLSKYLYRVQKLSSMFYTFRFHLASTLDKKEEEVYVQSFGAWKDLHPIKVDVDILGKIKNH